MITKDDVLRILPELPGDRINPANTDGTCLYTSSSGKHCIVGEILTRLGEKVPSYGSRRANVASFVRLQDHGFDFDIDEGAFYLLERLQKEADQAFHDDPTTATWGSIIEAEMGARNLL